MENWNYMWMCILALLPVAILLMYVRYCDRIRPEPWSKIILGVTLGVGAVLLTELLLKVIFRPLSSTWIFDVFYRNRLLNSAYRSFYLAAIPEESVKFVLLWLWLRINKDYDEFTDGIVYSVCIGLGFAGFENLVYLLSHESSWQNISIIRCLFTVPGHYIFAVCMGYYYSLVHFLPHKYIFYAILVWLVPVVSHGIYDFICIYFNGKASMVVIVYILLITFSILMHGFCYKKIKALQIMDQKLDLGT